ncbi:phospholipase A2 [Pochonia chlamydosporia 170]|uniref:Phospholipase A2 n=1 Tax=Pochonia chlamydosporia 170 TaxID=1380566 RepID=A0A179F7R5_METCM|nr:phospholipase A2 [Pochonia chlamydosporia 170]OAQ61468.1 phospholipase A2 [Pochonia chlamydosporia 170]
MKGFITTAVVFAVAASALPTASPAEALWQLENRATTCTNAATDNLIFTVSIDSFEKSRNAKDPSACDWSSDNCSWSPDKPDGFNFIPSCHRHDFGYRNTKAQKRFTTDMKTRIDDNFKKDLYKYCSQFSGIWSYKGVECRRIADIYVAFVRKLGKRVGEEREFTARETSILDIQLDD